MWSVDQRTRRVGGLYQSLVGVQAAESGLQGQNEEQDRSHEAQTLVLLLRGAWDTHTYIEILFYKDTSIDIHTLLYQHLYRYTLQYTHTSIERDRDRQTDRQTDAVPMNSRMQRPR